MPSLKKSGKTHKALCPFHEEKTPSFTVYPDHYYCFGCGASGDVYKFVAQMDGRDLKEVLKSEKYGKDTPQPATAKPKTRKKNEDAEFPPGDEGVVKEKTYPHPEAAFPKKGAVYVYVDETGEADFYVCRVETPDGDKRFYPVSKGDDGWYTGMREGVRPIYRLPELKKRPSAPVMVVEGEKTAEAAARLFPDYVVTTWSGGAAALEKTDFSPLAERRVVLCPDADAAGEAAMRRLAAKLEDMGCRASWFSPPPDCPAKWDWADFDGTPAQAAEMLAAGTTNPLPRPMTGFRLLGRANSSAKKIEYAFFLPGYGVAVYPAAEINAKTLSALCPDKEFWAAYSDGRDPFSRKGCEAISRVLSEAAARLPLFDGSEIRGPGVWAEQGGIAVNDGRTVTYLGQKYVGGCVIGSNVYVCSAPKNMPTSGGETFTEKDLVEFKNAFLNCGFRAPIHAKMVAGWTAIAPVCGSLNWRPHIWITGNAGSGKSWLASFIGAMLGDAKVVVQSDMTTEAGLRQVTAMSALPVIFDEADVSPERAQSFQHVIALARASSSPDAPKIVKGTVSGKSFPFHAKSAFLFSSIVPQLVHEQDKSRFFVAELKNPEEINDEERRKAHGICDKAYARLRNKSSAFFAFCFQNHAKIFALVEKAKKLLDGMGLKTRECDLIAPLVAGWCLVSGEKPEAVCAEYKNRENADAATQAHKSAAEYLTNAKIEYSTFTVSSALEALESSGAHEMKEAARSALRSLGIDFDGEHLYLVKNCKQLDKVFAGTAFERNYMLVLSRTPGAKDHHVRRMWGGKATRCLMLPHWLNL